MRGFGVAHRDFSASDPEAGADRLRALPDQSELRSRCVTMARDLCSLDCGGEAYRRIDLRRCADVVRESFR